MAATSSSASTSSALANAWPEEAANGRRATTPAGWRGSWRLGNPAWPAGRIRADCMEGRWFPAQAAHQAWHRGCWDPEDCNPNPKGVSHAELRSGPGRGWLARIPVLRPGGRDPAL